MNFEGLYINFVEFLALTPLNLDKRVKFSDNGLKFGQVLHGIHEDYIQIIQPRLCTGLREWWPPRK